MDRKLHFVNILPIGLMLFALFFGAGNLVFPAMLGQYAGDQYEWANLGFLMTGVGLPLLGVLAFGFSGTPDLLSLTRRVHPWFAVCYTTLLYLAIGPMFAMPRTGSVAFEIGIKPYIDPEYGTLILAVFTIFFFSLTLIFSLRPAKMIDIVGKMLTPALLASIALLIFAAIQSPISELQEPVEAYTSHAFFNGFQSGYLTMDALAAFVFGIIIIEAIRKKGVSKHKNVLFVCLQAATISAVFLAAIYTSLTYLGATSVGAFGQLANGGEVLNQAADHYFGTFGGAVLGIIVLLACLTTSIGLTTACSSYFHKLVPKISYRSLCVLLSVVSALLANIGLNWLIKFSEPVLSILYPLAIVLMILTFFHSLFRGKRRVYGLSLLFTFIVSSVSGLAATPLKIDSVHNWFSNYMPLYDIGLGWLIPACLGVLLGLLVPGASNRNKPAGGM